MTKKEWIALSISILSFILTRYHSTVWIGVVLGGIMSIWWIIYGIKLWIDSKDEFGLYKIKEIDESIPGVGVTCSNKENTTLRTTFNPYIEKDEHGVFRRMVDKKDFHYEYYPDPYEKRRD